MAKTVAKSDVFAKIGAKANKAFTSAKKKEVKLPGGGNVPGGIENGVARLTEINFAEFKKGDNKGKPYFMAQAVVVNPDGSSRPWIVNGQKVDGLQTKFGPEALCDTPAKKGQVVRENGRYTFDQHMDHVVNLFKLLAGKEAVESLENASELKELGDQLIEAGTYFTFRTWQPPKRKKGEPGYNPQYDGPDSPPSRVIETWGSAIEDFAQAESEGEEVEDEEEAEDGEEAEDESEETEEEDSEESEEDGEEEAEDDGLDELATEADKEKLTPAVKKARKELTEKAIEAGCDEDEVRAADTFADVVEMIRGMSSEETEDGEESGEDEEEAEESEETEGDEESEEQAPEVGGEYKYKPIDPKTKKPVKKAIDVTVTKVDEAKALAYVKDSATKKAILNLKTKKPLGIPFDSLIA